MGLRILNPAGIGDSKQISLAPRAGRPGNKPVFLLSNNKPNVDLLFQHVTRTLEGAGYRVEHAKKSNAAVGCPSDLLDRMGREAGWVLNALGD